MLLHSCHGNKVSRLHPYWFYLTKAITAIGKELSQTMFGNSIYSTYCKSEILICCPSAWTLCKLNTWRFCGHTSGLEHLLCTEQIILLSPRYPSPQRNAKTTAIKVWVFNWEKSHCSQGKASARAFSTARETYLSLSRSKYWEAL